MRPIMVEQMAYALITGASSGIGRHLAFELAAKGLDVVLVARNDQALQDLKAEIETRYRVRASVMGIDLSVPGAAADLYTQVRSTWPVPDVLVNNAGFGSYGVFHEADGEVLQRLVQVNILALTCLLRRVLPEMRARGNGRILNVASCAAFNAGPLMAVYFATKAYVLHLSEAVSQECVGSGVTVTALCPGATATEFHRTAGFPENSWLFAPPVAAQPAAVAKYGIRALYAGRRIAIPGVMNKLSILGLRVVPRRLAVVLAHRIMKH